MDLFNNVLTNIKKIVRVYGLHLECNSENNFNSSQLKLKKLLKIKKH